MTRRSDGISVRPARAGDRPAFRDLLATLQARHAVLRPDFFAAPRILDGDAPRSPGDEDDTPAPAAFERLLRSRDELLLVAELAPSAPRPARRPATENAPPLLGLLRAGLRDTPASPELRPRRRLHVESLVVAAGRRRLGVGRRLMEAAEAWGRERGAEQVVLTVWSGNRSAERFYRALGYGEVNRVLARELP